MNHLVGGLGLLRRRVGLTLMALVMIPVGMLLGVGMIGIPILSHTLKSVLRGLTSAGRERAGEPRPELKGYSWAGALTILGLATSGGSFVLLALAVDHSLPEAARGVGVSLLAGWLASVGVGAALGPLLFAPLYSADGVKGALAPFSRSFQLAARIGAAASARIGALAGGISGAGFVVASLLVNRTDGGGWVILAAPIGAGLGIPIALAVLTDAFVTHEGAETEVKAGTTSRRLRGLWGLLAPALIGIVGAFVVAAVTPTQMENGLRYGQQTRGVHGVGPVYGAQEQRLPGTSVTVRTAPRGVSVEAADGGGAGLIHAGFDVGDEAELAVFEVRAAPGTFVVAVSDGTRWAHTRVDADGVRLDDSLSDRVFGRLGRLGLGALGVGLLLLLWIAFSLGSELGTARALDVPDLMGEGRRGGGLRALEGTLRLGSESTLRYGAASGIKRLLGHMAAGRLLAEGEAWVEADAGAIRLRFPDRPVPVLEGDPTEWEGEHVVVLSTFEDLTTIGLRSSSVPWPEDGTLTLGRPADASEALVARAVRRASWVAFPTLLLLGLAAAKLLLEL